MDKFIQPAKRTIVQDPPVPRTHHQAHTNVPSRSRVAIFHERSRMVYSCKEEANSKHCQPPKQLSIQWRNILLQALICFGFCFYFNFVIHTLFVLIIAFLVWCQVAFGSWSLFGSLEKWSPIQGVIFPKISSKYNCNKLSVVSLQEVMLNF